ncbi:hypothetical protein QJS10_CPA06g01896 [Acorus calamus]|uniref:SMP domain-containing protein n=1 Tax=Acorus calamus TaxID=4465 RepID=A0AAV9ESI6_ACOCL|nr:hypothetical protein QJS10_CPA06g01896 [Acorus calamus]
MEFSRDIGSMFGNMNGMSSADPFIRTSNKWFNGERALNTWGLDFKEDATTKLPADKEVTGEDAERVTGVELRNNLVMMTYRGGVAV